MLLDLKGSLADRAYPILASLVCPRPVAWGKSEADHERLITSPSSTIITPRLADAPVALECRVHSIQRIGENRLVLGLIEAVHVRDELYDPEHRRIRTDLYHPVGRMAVPNWYCTTRDQFEIVRPA